MHVIFTLHIRMPKRMSAPMAVSVIAHLPGQSPHDEPHVVTPFDRRPAYTSDDVAGRVNRLQRTRIPLDALSWFFEPERQKDTQELVLEAVRAAAQHVRRQCHDLGHFLACD